MKTRIQKWGNSLALRIPRPFAEESNLHEDSPVDITLRNGKLVVVPLQEQEFTRNLLKIGVKNPTLGLFSPTQAKQGAVLQSLVSDRVLRIVKGTDPLSAISNLISDWQSQGGTQISKEFAEAASKA